MIIIILTSHFTKFHNSFIFNSLEQKITPEDVIVNVTVFVCVCVHACVCACMRTCVCVCVHLNSCNTNTSNSKHNNMAYTLSNSTEVMLDHLLLG